MNYLQKKKQAIIMILAAQIIKTAEGYPVTINDCESGAAVDYTVWGNTVPGKNLIPYPYYQTTKTSNGITFTDNGDGSITVNGTATAQAQFFITTSIIDFVDKTKVYVLSGGKDSNVVLRLDFIKEKTWKKLIDTGADGKAIIDFTQTNVEYDRLNVSLIVKSNAVCDNIIIKPQLELGETATEYELYTENYVGDRFLASDSSYKYKIPLVNSAKNLISYPYINTTKTVNGITFTDNGDGTVTANGTATGEAVFKMSYFTIKNGVKYYLSGCPKGGSESTYYFWFRGYNRDTGNGQKIAPTNDFTNNFEIVIKKGTVLDNLIFKPQLEPGETATEYEPYRTPATANIYLDKPLKKGESVNFGADRLPELQLFEGSNIITADTEVKPERISVDYYEKESE